MKYLKWLFVILGFIYFYYTFLGNLENIQIIDIFASYSGRNAISLHFSVYMCLISLINSEKLKILRSECVIRQNRLKIIKDYMKSIVFNSFVFLMVFYIIGSLFVIYYLGIEYYVATSIYVPCILSIIAYTAIYVIFGIILLFCYLFTKKIILSINLTTILSIILNMLMENVLGHLSFFEMFYDEVMIIFPFIQVFIITLFILVILYNILIEVFQRKDLIYEQKI